LKNNDSDGFGSFSPNDSNDSKLKRETSENFLSGLPPPFQLSRKNREFAEKSRFVSNFAKDDEVILIKIKILKTNFCLNRNIKMTCFRP
jgi:hypothetical protein